MFARCLLLVYILLVFSLCLFVACVMLVCCVILFVCCKPDTLRFFYFYKSLLEAKIFEKLVKKAETGSLLKFGKRLQQYLESLPGRSRGFPGFVHPVFFFCRNNRILLYKFCTIVVVTCLYIFLFRVVRILFYTKAFSHELPARVWMVHVFTYFLCSCDGPPEYV